MKSAGKSIVKAFNLMFNNDTNDWVKILIKMKNNIKNDFDLLNLCNLIVFCQSFLISACDRNFAEICKLSEYKFIIKSEKSDDEWENCWC